MHFILMAYKLSVPRFLIPILSSPSPLALAPLQLPPYHLHLIDEENKIREIQQ